MITQALVIVNYAFVPYRKNYLKNILSDGLIQKMIVCYNQYNRTGGYI